MEEIVENTEPVARPNGETLVRLRPEAASSWIQRAVALGELGRPEEAFLALLPAMEVFPDEPMIDFHLAGFACQAGELAMGKGCLEESLSREDAVALKLMALEFRLLQPLWDHIGEV